MRNRRHTIATPPPERRTPLSLLLVDEGSVLTAPTATPLELHLPSHGLPSWGAIASSIVLQAPGAWACTRYVVVAMYAPAVSFISTLDEWEVSNPPAELTAGREEDAAGEYFPPHGAARRHGAAAPRAPWRRRGVRHPRGRAGCPTGSSPVRARPLAALDTNVPLHDYAFALHERRGIDLPVLHLPRGRPRPPASALALKVGLEPSSTTSIATVQQRKAQATPLTGKTSWGNWFAWSP